MEEFFEFEDLQILKDNRIELPSAETVINDILPKVAKMYLDFIKKGVTYEVESQREFGKDYYFINKSDRKPGGYETIGQWAEEFTGDCGPKFGFIGPMKYADEIEEVMREYIASLFDSELMADCDIYIGGAESELVAEVMERSIFEIRKLSKI